MLLCLEDDIYTCIKMFVTRECLEEFWLGCIPNRHGHPCPLTIASVAVDVRPVRPRLFCFYCEVFLVIYFVGFLSPSRSTQPNIVQVVTTSM